MNLPDRDLTALVGSRICHDLINPLGAISNGIELIALSGLSQSPEMALIAESVEQATARIRFFRIAFGAAPHGAKIASPEIAAILDAQFRGTRVTCDWGPAVEVSRRDVKLAFLAVLCAVAALPVGGAISVAQARGKWTVTAADARLRLNDQHWDVLRGTAPAVEDAAHVQFALLATLCLGRNPPLTVTAAAGTGRLQIAF